jgi:hypothetical protein
LALGLAWQNKKTLGWAECTWLRKILIMLLAWKKKTLLDGLNALGSAK